MNQSDIFSRQLGDKIRHAKEPDNPALVSIWLDMQESQFVHHNHKQRWSVCCSAIDLLLDAYADELNPSHWRAVCLDNLVRPLAALQRMAASEQHQRELQAINRKISTISSFYAASCCHSSHRHNLN